MVLHLANHTTTTMKKLLILPLLVALTVSGCRYTQDASDTAFNEFKASSLLEKYTRFKDMYAALDAKRASIKALQGKIESTEAQYKGVPRNHNEWLLVGRSVETRRPYSS